jgi:hypothetical protein
MRRGESRFKSEGEPGNRKRRCQQILPTDMPKGNASGAE